jgi:hypothetical protein
VFPAPPSRDRPDKTNRETHLARHNRDSLASGHAAMHLSNGGFGDAADPLTVSISALRHHVGDVFLVRAEK